MDDQNQEKLIQEKIKIFRAAGDFIPGIKTIQQVNGDYRTLYICENGQNHFGINESNFLSFSQKEYQQKIFHSRSRDTQLIEIKKNNKGKFLEYAVYINRYPAETGCLLQLVQIKNFLINSSGLPVLSFTQFMPLKVHTDFQVKIERLMDEIQFKKMHHSKFRKLSKRHLQVLELLAKYGKTKTIAEKLFITPNTVESHKKKIKEHLGINQHHKLILYALAFDRIQFEMENESEKENESQNGALKL